MKEHVLKITAGDVPKIVNARAKAVSLNLESTVIVYQYQWDVYSFVVAAPAEDSSGLLKLAQWLDSKGGYMVEASEVEDRGAKILGFPNPDKK